MQNKIKIISDYDFWINIVYVLSNVAGGNWDFFDAIWCKCTKNIISIILLDGWVFVLFLSAKITEIAVKYYGEIWNNENK